jgi:peptide deformylase
MAISKIVQAGDPVLRRRARDLTPDEITTPKIQDLIARLRDTMHAHPLVGLAAVQIGEPVQVTVIEEASIPFHVLINPRLTIEDRTIDWGYEGCQSVPGNTMVIVPRYRKVRIEALDEHGKPFVKVATSWYARIVQHEVDHLTGVLICDRMDPRTLTTHENHARHYQGMSPDAVRAAVGKMPED